ncbi:MAG: hypothetical protein WD045_08405 [Pirellulaceae bacterium]
MPKCKSIFTVSLTLLGLLAGINLAIACTVPVYRFALERWPADPYEVYVYYEGELTSEQRSLLEPLAKADRSEGTGGNVRLHLVDVQGPELNGPVKEVWERQESPQSPWVVARSPRTAPNVATVFSGPLTEQRVDTLLNSPARQTIAERILAGQSTVWVLLESGDQEKDQQALETLTSRLEQLTEELQIPEQSPDVIATANPDAPQLRVDFSIVQVARDDPREEAFVKMLMETEADLKEFEGEPLAFPVCGRGRTIYGLVGAGINDGTIQEACEFLIGPCSCQVKEQNPGVDLLMNIQWGELVEESIGHERELPPLSGLDKFVEVAMVQDATRSATDETTNTSTAADEIVIDFPPDSNLTTSAPQASPDEQHGEHSSAHENIEGDEAGTSPLRRNMLIVIAIGVVVIVGGGTVMVMRPS